MYDITSAVVVVTVDMPLGLSHFMIFVSFLNSFMIKYRVQYNSPTVYIQ